MNLADVEWMRPLVLPLIASCLGLSSVGWWLKAQRNVGDTQALAVASATRFLAVSVAAVSLFWSMPI
jgi:hypothetical protein